MSNYSNCNLGLAFYRKYYEDWDFENDRPKNGLASKGVPYARDMNNKQDVAKMEKSYFVYKSKSILNQQLTTENLFGYKLPAINSKISLRTSYPGLLLGTGYIHGIGKTGEHKIGFFFDHTTGLPIIPGSSVKGVLRSVFPIRYQEQARFFEKENKPKASEVCKKMAEASKIFLQKLLKTIAPNIQPNGSIGLIEQIELEIFEGKYFSVEGNTGNQLPMPLRDVFHDAIITDAKNSAILGNDFITPHKNTKKNSTPDELVNPNPIQFLKVLPGIQFTFQFKLPEGNDQFPRLLDSKKRKQLFEKILHFKGIGAKTNVGYGKLLTEEEHKQVNSPGSNKNKKSTAKRKDNNLRPSQKETVDRTKNKDDWEKLKNFPLNKIKGVTIILGKLIDNQNNKVVFKPDVKGYQSNVEVKHPTANRLEIGKMYKIKVNKEGKGEKTKLILTRSLFEKVQK